MLTPLDSRVSDMNAECIGIPIRELMGNAGRAVADFLKERYNGSKILFVCGSGNNGGDGFAAALLMDPKLVTVALLCEPSKIRSDESRFYYSLLECDILPYSKELIERNDVVVDCALGTGTIGEPRGLYRQFIEDVNPFIIPIVSVDIPSGMGSGVSISPDFTITFMDIKEGMSPSNSGFIVVADIGIPSEAYINVGPGDMLRYPIPQKDSHKGQNGRLMAISGGPYFGAPILGCSSAFRTGVDIVRLFIPEISADIVAGALPVLMISRLPGSILTTESVDMLVETSSDYSAVLIGPGIGNDEETMQAVRDFVSRCKIPMVIDADAIGAVRDMVFDVPVILTPHKGEFQRLGGGKPEDVAKRMNAVILLKGSTDVVTDGERTRYNNAGTPAMTGAGTGDVLAGCVAALLSKGLSAFESACLGAFICGTAGEKAYSEKSYGLIATDIVDRIPSVLREYLR